MKYRVGYWEDEFSMVAETVIEAENEKELSVLVDKYYEEHLKDTKVAGANWSKIEM